MQTLLLALALSADVSHPQATAIQFDLEKAQGTIDTRYGHKKPAELSNEDRRQMIRDRAEAERSVLEEHHVSAKDWVKSQATRSPTEQAEVKRDVAALVMKEKAAQAKQPEDAEARPVEVQRGFGEQTPVTMEEARGGKVAVEKELPPEVKEEADLLADHDRLEATGADKSGAAHPAGHGKAGGEKHR